MEQWNDDIDNDGWWLTRRGGGSQRPGDLIMESREGEQLRLIYVLSLERICLMYVLSLEHLEEIPKLNLSIQEN